MSVDEPGAAVVQPPTTAIIIHTDRRSVQPLWHVHVIHTDPSSMSTVDERNCRTLPVLLADLGTRRGGRSCYWHAGMGATTAEKLEGTSRVVDACLSISPFLPLFLFRLPLLLHPRFTRSLTLFSILPVNSASRSAEAP